ncbi:MAG: hypothetical protein ACK4NQ_01575 [Fimbriimonadaceae bacterium]
MARIRTIKPGFFKHGDLFDSEQETGLPLRLAFAGVWCLCDREGRFRWKPREMKLDVLPYDDVDFSRVLDALATRGFLVKYQCEGVMYGWVPTFTEHQVINNREAPSTIPAFEPEMAVIADAWLTRAPRVNDAAVGEGKGREGKGREYISPDASTGEKDGDHQDDSTHSKEEELPWYENPEYPNKPIQRVAQRIAATKVRSQSNPFPYRDVTEAQARKALEYLADCPDAQSEGLFWGAWDDYHSKKTKGQYTRYDQAIGNWAAKRKGEWATARRLQGNKLKTADYERPPVWTPGGAA